MRVLVWAVSSLSVSGVDTEEGVVSSPSSLFVVSSSDSCGGGSIDFEASALVSTSVIVSTTSDSALARLSSAIAFFVPSSVLIFPTGFSSVRTTAASVICSDGIGEWSIS